MLGCAPILPQDDARSAPFRRRGASRHTEALRERREPPVVAPAKLVRLYSVPPNRR